MKKVWLIWSQLIFFYNSILYVIVEESNESAIQVNPPAPLKLTGDNLEQFIGILYTTSMVKMTSTRLYWSKEFDFEKIASTMTVNKFEKIENFLHCNDNLNHPEECTDRLYKIGQLPITSSKIFQN